MTKFDPEYRSATLVNAAGGAILCKTKTCILIGLWEKEAKSSDGKNQNDGDARMQVEDRAVYLRE